MATPTTRTADCHTVTVTVKMTPAQRASYAREYGMEAAEVHADVAARIANELPAILSAEYWLREYTSLAVNASR